MINRILTTALLSCVSSVSLAQDAGQFEQAFKRLSLNERKAIQQELNDYGNYGGGVGYSGAIDGLWGRNTSRAIIGAYTDTFQYFPKNMWDTEAQFLSYILEPYEFWGEGGECDGCGEGEEVVEVQEEPEASTPATTQVATQDSKQPSVRHENLSNLPISRTINTSVDAIAVEKGERVLLQGIANSASVDAGGVLEINGVIQHVTNNGGTLVINGVVTRLTALAGKTRIRGMVQNRSGPGEIFEGDACNMCEFEFSEKIEKPIEAVQQSPAQRLLAQPNAIQNTECTVISNEGILKVGLSIFDNDTVEYRQDGLAIPMQRGSGNGTFDSDGDRYVVDISDPRGVPILVLFNTSNNTVQFNVMGGLLVHNGQCN